MMASSIIITTTTRRSILRRGGVFGRCCWATTCGGGGIPLSPLGGSLSNNNNNTTSSTSTSTTRLHSTRCFSTASSFDLMRNNVTGPCGSFQIEYERSIQDPESFWKEASKQIHWFESPKTILEQPSDPNQNPNLYQWFSDGVTNTCYNCLDVHVNAGRGTQPAIYYDSPFTGVKQTITYNQLLEQVSTFASVLKDIGIDQNDRVIIYMPMIPQALIAMLACSRIGACHSVVFGGFASKELATRIIDCQPTLIVSASCGVEPNRIVEYKPLLDQAIQIARDAGTTSVKNTIIVQRSVHEKHNGCQLNEPFDLDYDELMKSKQNSDLVDAVPLPSNHPHYILYTSGTTGLPKGIVRDTGGYAVALKYTMSSFYDTYPGDVYCAASDIGWVVGHSYTVYAPLLNGSTTVLYEGKPVGAPDGGAGAFWRMIEEYKIRTLFAAPTAFRAMKQVDPHALLARNYDLSSLNALFVAGEHCDPDTLQFCQAALEDYNGDVKYAIDHWWQTELGHPGVGNAIGLGRMPLKPGGCSAPAPGYDIRIVNDEAPSGSPVIEKPPGKLGDMVIKLPLPPGTLTTLYNNEQGYIDSYLTRYPGYYDTGDAAYQDKDTGYIHIMGRTDDVINVAGHRLSTGALEEVLLSHKDVADCAVVPIRDELKGQVPAGFVVLNSDCTAEEKQLIDDLILIVRETVGPVASFKLVAVVKALPKTRSGKILRGTMSKIANGEEYTITPTVEDPNIFTYLEPIIQDLVGER